MMKKCINAWNKWIDGPAEPASSRFANEVEPILSDEKYSDWTRAEGFYAGFQAALIQLKTVDEIKNILEGVLDLPEQRSAAAIAIHKFIIENQ